MKNGTHEMAEHPIVNLQTLERIFEQNKDRSQMIPLREYLKVGPKPRGTDPKKALNSHFETVITSEEIDQKRLAGRQFAIDSLGNPNQTVYAMVHGYNPDDPTSGYERPVVEEGPHMIIGLYAVDPSGRLHIFRTLQIRTNRLVIDTPRGFASAKMLKNGEQIYTANQDEVMANLARILKEEVGKLAILEVQDVGADILNTSFVISKSAYFAVRVDYSSFMSIRAVLDSKEVRRRLKQFKHEGIIGGIIGGIIDMTLDEFFAYMNNRHITHDIAADHISYRIAMNHMRALLQALNSTY